MTIILEDDGFHAALFYLKCLCVPFVLGALIMFCIRLYLNDLYVSIPDRLLITCALAQTLHNIPVEALIAEGNMWEASPYLKLLDDLSKFTLISSFFLFWLIYTKDKVSTTKFNSFNIAIFYTLHYLIAVPYGNTVPPRPFQKFKLPYRIK